MSSSAPAARCNVKTRLSAAGVADDMPLMVPCVPGSAALNCLVLGFQTSRSPNSFPSRISVEPPTGMKT